MDESALSTIFPTKRRKQVGAINAERGIRTTVICCMNPIGHFIPPAVILAIQKIKIRVNRWCSNWHITTVLRIRLDDRTTFS
ncbi:hypothetical protein NQ317_000306 [Molorchus minor]|uniref:Uncharacterized protein n=1 Tax=Molorchus minor TaxID=1323400 RepID=A0ABQ9IXI5_9CUCU|nr:hypothetical protein NQ317_000306 [Molorchus minor]